MVQREVSSSPASDERHQPIRTCVGCRKRELAAALLRVVAEPVSTGWQVIPDRSCIHPGRGAWIHRSPDCLAVAQRRQAFVRALRISGKLDITAVANLVESLASAAPTPAREEQVATNS